MAEEKEIKDVNENVEAKETVETGEVAETVEAKETAETNEAAETDEAAAANENTEAEEATKTDATATENEDEKYILLVDEKFKFSMPEEDFRALKPILVDFVKTAAENQDKEVESWLIPKMQEQLPDKKPEEIRQMAEEIITTLKTAEEKQAALEAAVANGRTKESWFASEIKQYTSYMSTQESVEYLKNLDNALTSANAALHNTFMTQAGEISQNPSLDGYIAEQWHAQTFNLKAAATGSPYRAEVKEPPQGAAYGKNSVDIVIKDEAGHEVRRYQSKYCKDADATNRAFNEGDYRGQRKLVPSEQVEDVPNSSTVIEAPDGTTSEPLSKRRAMEMRDEAQSGKWNDLNWNEYKTKDVAIGIGKQAGFAAIQGAAIGTGMYVVQKMWDGEEVDGDEVVEKAVETGADFGIKAAAAGALKVGVEKNVITFIPKGTPISTLANIAHVAVENVKVLGKVASGELTLKEGLDKMQEVTVSTVAGIAASTKGAAIGAAVGTVFGPVGTVVGGVVGGTIGYIAGSKVGEVVVKTAQKVRDAAVDVVKTTAKAAAKVGKAVVSGVGSVISSIGSAIGSLFDW